MTHDRTSKSICSNIQRVGDADLQRLGHFIEGRLQSRLDLVHHQEQECLARYHEWQTDKHSDLRRTEFIVALCKLLDLQPELEQMSNDLADLDESLGA